MTSPEQLENLQSLGRQALEEAAKSYEDVVGNAIRMEAKLVCELDYGIVELCYLSNENRYQRNFALAPSCF